MIGDQIMKKKTNEITQIGLVAALYFVITMTLSAFSFGVIQFRVAESFNHLVIFNKRYILAVAIGCLLANLFSPLGLIDMLVGIFQTLFMLSLSYFATKKINIQKTKFIVSTIICSLSMFIIAFELVYVFNLPFWETYLFLFIGEALSMVIGSLIVYPISKRIDLNK